jgi:hypothetical protein
MSQKVTSKNLSYDAAPPPFLARMQAQASGNPGPDPILAAQRRAAKKRSGSEEAEDAPLVLDEDGNAVNVEFDKDGTVRENAKHDKPDGDEVEAQASETTRPKHDDAKAAIGGRKRKVGKVIGDAADEPLKASKDKAKDAAEEPPKDRKPKKKAKKVKLSFDEDDG